MINRAIQLRDSMDQYCYILGRSTEDADRSVDLDILSGNDWNALIQIKAILKPFYSVTKHLEGNAVCSGKLVSAYSLA